jgi:acid phosphatase type 7
MNPRRATGSLILAALPLLALGSWSVVTRAQTAEKLSKGPIIGDIRTDGATITWVTTRRLGRLRTTAGTRMNVENREFRQVEVRGLEPGKVQDIDVGTDEMPIPVSFMTATVGDTPFSFVAYGDTRTRHDVHRKIVERILAEKPAFVLHTGDLVSNGENPEDWDNFFRISGDLLSKTGFYPIPGNHERNVAIFAKYFSVPGGNMHHFAFDWGNTHFAAVDSDEVGDSREAKDSFVQSQIEWLRDDLKKNKKPLVFVFMHHPLYTAVANRTEAAAKIAQKFEGVLLEGRVAAAFYGHDHNYQHHFAKGIHHIVTGGGGAPLYDVKPIPEITVKTLKTENYVRVQVEGSKAKLEAISLEGTVLDSFEIQSKTP